MVSSSMCFKDCDIGQQQDQVATSTCMQLPLFLADAQHPHREATDRKAL